VIQVRRSRPAQEIVVENSQYGLTWFRVRFGLLQCKAFTKGEHVLRFAATVHNTRELRCRRGLDNFPEIITRLAGITDRFATTLDCADIAFIADTTLDDLPLPSQLSATRTGGIDLNKPRIRDPGRRAQPQPRAQTRHLDPRGPRLRDPPHRHADPLPRPRHHNNRMNNILSMGETQASRQHFVDRMKASFELAVGPSLRGGTRWMRGWRTTTWFPGDLSW
jgi:hypothetical protein